MSVSRFAMVLSLLAMMACSSKPVEPSDAGTPGRITVANPSLQSTLTRHTIRQLATRDLKQMEDMMNHELDRAEKSSGRTFVRLAAQTMSETILMSPFPGELTGDFKSRLEHGEYLTIVQATSQLLLTMAQQTEDVAAQASAIYALDNLVGELQGQILHETDFREEFKAVLKDISATPIHITPNARDYARQQIDQLLNPADAAHDSLNHISVESAAMKKNSAGGVIE